MLTILTKPRWHDALQELAPSARFVESLEELTGGGVLISYSTGVIVPPTVLSRYERAYNFHAATPHYPGRDPHHWAAYDGVHDYGATCHVMAAKVDAGPIIGVGRRHPCVSGMSPHDYRTIGEETAKRLFAEFLPSLLDGTAEPNGEKWTGATRRRVDLIAMCDFRGLDPRERQRREFAFQGFERHFVS